MSVQETSNKLLAAAKLRKLEDIKGVLENLTDVFQHLQHGDDKGRTVLHILAAAGSEEAIEYVVNKAACEASRLVALQDEKGNTPLHLCSHSPMAMFTLASARPETCLQANKEGMTPVDYAQRHISGEPLNALLLACSSSPSPESLRAIRILTLRGAVPDTWAPNGQSSLMLAAANDNAQGLRLLLQAGASLEMQDSMGRTALMWAAGCGTTEALKELLDSGASVAHRDRRGRTVAEYAAEFPEAVSIIECKVKQLENKAIAAQEALLAELCAEEEKHAATKASKKAKKKAAKEKRRLTVQQEEEEQQQHQEEQQQHQEEEQDGEPVASVCDVSQTQQERGQELEKDDQGEEATAVGQESTFMNSSPEWITVKKSSGKKGPIPPTENSNSTHVLAVKPAHHRTLSGVSIASLGSSVTSHDTDARDSHSVNSMNSERSVLKRAPLVASNKRTVTAPPCTDFEDLPSSAGGGAVTAPTVQQQKDEEDEDEARLSNAMVEKDADALDNTPNVDKIVVAFKSTLGNSTWASIAAATGTANDGHQKSHQTEDPSVSLPPMGATPPVDSASVPYANGTEHFLLAEIVRLQAEIRRLQVERMAEENSHQQELAAVMQDAARHEAHAVAAAIQETEMNCIVKFASLLQNQLLTASVQASDGHIHDYYYKQQQYREQQQQHQQQDLPFQTGLCAATSEGFSAPLTSPFSFEVGEGLRGEYLGNHSAFVVPASEPEVLAAHFDG